MLQKLGPALIGAAIGMLLYWGMTKFMGDQAPHAGSLPQASIALPPLTPVDAVDATTLTAGIRGAESGELTAGIRGAETTDEVVGTMADRPASAGTPTPQPSCFDHEVVPRLVVAPDYPYTARVSVGPNGTQGNSFSYSPAVSRDGRFVAVGDNAAMGRFVGGDTRIVELGGKTVVPGLIDSHLHQLFADVLKVLRTQVAGASHRAAACRPA